MCNRLLIRINFRALWAQWIFLGGYYYCSCRARRVSGPRFCLCVYARRQGGRQIKFENAKITKNRKDEFLIICDCEVAGLNETSYKRPSNQTVCMWFQENNPPAGKSH